MFTNKQIKKNDNVEVIAGKEKGRVGKVLKVDPMKKRALVEKINIVKKHTKPSAQYQQGGIFNKENYIDLSNLTLICPKCSKSTKKVVKILDDKSKIQICNKCGDNIYI